MDRQNWGWRETFDADHLFELILVGRARHSVRAGRMMQPDGAHGVTRPTLPPFL